MKFAPRFPSWQSIAQTIAFIIAVVGGIESSRKPLFGTSLVLIAIILFWLARYLKPKTQT